ncbi:hypothetical protein M0L20_28740 [Spirosoma sp. RP8]|uniref:Uncharacterized protein n=1 Tax=Spirosoma liriopis TaxID=2937440 RepID=A0ABT0HUI9_9BACT|nr:hypothetical protein [Spirosoma liriopis]MCK8495888.1 hypothetical protein [Spirosoma liriopis]
MKTALMLIVLLCIVTASCQQSDSIPPKEDVEALYQRFHGKYKVVSSTSSEPLDVNLDGVSSTNLLQEILELNNYGAFLELRVKSVYGSMFLFSQFWPEQYINTYSGSTQWNGRDTLSYNPTHLVNYANQAGPYRFSFSDDLSQIVVTAVGESDSIRWVKPESVFIEANDRLRVINKRRIYTRQGVKEVMITTRYERFTIIT